MKYEVYILPFSIVVVVYFWTSSFVVRTSKIHIVLVRRDKGIEKKVSRPEYCILGSCYAQNILQQTVSIRVKTLSNTLLVASRHVKKERPHAKLKGGRDQKSLCLSSVIAFL